MRRCLQMLRHLGRNEEGSVLFMAAGVIVVLVMLCGAVVDYGLLQIVKNRVSQATVAATLASSQGNLSDAQALQIDARKYFALNFTDNYLNSDITPRDLHVSITNRENSKMIQVSLVKSTNTTFMNMLGMGDNHVQSQQHSRVRERE